MTTHLALLLDPTRGTFWGWAGPAGVVLVVALAALVDRLREPHRNPADVYAVVGLRTARRALARVDRLDMEDGTHQAAALRLFTGVYVWAKDARHSGGRRRQDAVHNVLADAVAGLQSLGADPDGELLLGIQTGGRPAYLNCADARRDRIGGDLKPPPSDVFGVHRRHA